jgi:hypothetical protein
LPHDTKVHAIANPQIRNLPDCKFFTAQKILPQPKMANSFAPVELEPHDVKQPCAVKRNQPADNAGVIA